MSYYTDHLFTLNEVGPKGMERLGGLWMKHHDRAWDHQLEARFGKKQEQYSNRGRKIWKYLKGRAARYGKEAPSRTDIGYALGKKLGIEHNPGNPGSSTGTVFNRGDVYDTLHQRSGERAMRAVSRLSDWYDKKGLYQN